MLLNAVGIPRLLTGEDVNSGEGADPSAAAYSRGNPGYCSPSASRNDPPLPADSLNRVRADNRGNHQRRGGGGVCRRIQSRKSWLL